MCTSPYKITQGLGPQDGEEVCLIHPSTQHPLQNGEAMRSGQPIAATGLGGHRGSLKIGQRRRRAEGSLSGRESAQA